MLWQVHSPWRLREIPLAGAAAVHDARALADLERKLWHAQKARDALSRSLSLEVFDLS